MPSRMERYYQTEVDISKRTEKNQNLYNNIHKNVDYTDIKQIQNANEIDVAKLNELLNATKKNNSRALKNENIEVIQAEDNEEIEDKNYDIKDVLEKAKTDKTSNQYDYHKLKEEQLNLLKKIENYKASKQEQDENLNELLNTIANTNLLKDINDRDLSLDLLGDLKSNNEETIVGGINSINKIMSDVPKEKHEVEEKNEIDNSFYTSSMKFNKEDFDELNEIKTKLNKNNTMMKIIASILAVIVVIIIVLLIIK